MTMHDMIRISQVAAISSHPSCRERRLFTHTHLHRHFLNGRKLTGREPPNTHGDNAVARNGPVAYQDMIFLFSVISFVSN